MPVPLSASRSLSAGDLMEETDGGVGSAYTLEARAACAQPLRRRVEWYSVDTANRVALLGAWGSLSSV
ncbi:MAG: hypothetical protein QME96_08230, partial [Myxococcota bacterium]|nr:hypothetical protein [Myxococcota bacterium]